MSRGVFSGDDKIAEYLIGSARAGVDIGAVLGTKGLVTAGLQWTQVNARVDTGDPILPSVRELTAGPRVLLTIDQLDHAWFPRAGYSAVGDGIRRDAGLGSARQVPAPRGPGQRRQVLGPAHVQLSCLGRHGLRLEHAGVRVVHAGRTACGFPAFRLDQFAGREYAFGRVMYYNRVMALPDLLGSGVYAGRVGGSGLDQGPRRRLAVAGHAVFGVAVPRRGHVRRPRVSWYRLWHRQQFWRLLASWGALTPIALRRIGGG